uniref:Uncharacterized protein n=1 Tax=Anguilla anguilla TaxID=7936 RepID=A0A0E9WGU2_ANGAN
MFSPITSDGTLAYSTDCTITKVLYRDHC